MTERTGAPTRRLAAQLAQLDQAAAGLRQAAATFAEQAVASFRTLTGQLGVDAEAAGARVVGQLHGQIGQVTGSVPAYLLADPKDGLPAIPEGRIRRLCDEVTARQATVRQLLRDVQQSPAAAVELFVEYRDVHGRDEDMAAAQALLDVAEGLDAANQLADRGGPGVADEQPETTRA
jgi:hypothetical protein